MNNLYKLGWTLIIISIVFVVLGIVLFFINIVAGLLCIGCAAAFFLSGRSVVAKYVASVAAYLELEMAKRQAEKEAEVENSDDIDDDKEDPV